MPVAGNAASSLLVGGFWVDSRGGRAAGVRGERRTAAILDPIFEYRDALLIHDVKVRGVAANIDHLVVSGRMLQIVDTKVWGPGKYRMFFGYGFRGWKRARWLDLSGIYLMRDVLADRFPSLTVLPPIVAVHAARSGAPHLGGYRPKNVRVVPIVALPGLLDGLRAAPDEGVVALLKGQFDGYEK